MASDFTPSFGRLPAPDPRDRRFLMVEAVPAIVEAPLPPRHYWKTGAVLDQGKTPTCVGHAWRQWLSSSPLMTKGGPDAFGIYHAAQEVDEWEGRDYDGTSVRAGAKVLQALGHIGTYVWAHDADMARRFVLLQGPVVLGTEWSEGMMKPETGAFTDTNGFIRHDGASVGGHAYLAVGYDSDRAAFRIVNSWGASWGQGGRAWISLADVDRLIKDGGECCAAVEVKLPPAR